MSNPDKQPDWQPRRIKAKDKSNTIYSPDILHEVPELASEIGRIIVAWGYAERTLAKIMAYATQAEEWVVAEMLEGIHNFSKRVRRVRETLSEKVGKKRSDSMYHSHLQPIEDMAKSRNDLAHGYFIKKTLYPGCLILEKRWGKKTEHYVYDLKTLEALRSEIVSRTMLLDQLLWWILTNFPPKHASGAMIVASNVHMRPSEDQLREIETMFKNE